MASYIGSKVGVQDEERLQEYERRADPDDPQHQSIIERAVRLEQALLARGELSSDFRLIVARP